MIALVVLALLARHRARRAAPAADRSNCITGKPCRRGCSLFCALEE